MNPRLTYCPAVLGEDGGLGVTHSLQREEASNEFLFKFFIPARESLPGPVQELHTSESQPLSRLRQDELTRTWANGLTLCGLLAQAPVMWLYLSSAQSLLDDSCKKLMKVLCSCSSSFGGVCVRVTPRQGCFP